MDEFTLKHLKAWAEEKLYDDERERIVAAIIAKVKSDPGIEYLGWPRLREIVDRE